jgi:hypothetical protein
MMFFTLTGINAQETLTTSGDNANGNGGSTSYSIGQIAYVSVDGLNGSANQGVQQPYEIYSLGVDDFSNISLSMTVFPNPTSNFITLKIGNYNIVKMNYELLDLSGKLIFSQVINQPEIQIPMENLRCTTYILKITQNNKLLKTFKIIKKQ